MGISVPLVGPDATGSDIALIDPGARRQVTYSELEDRVGVVAAAIQAIAGTRAVVTCEMNRTLADIIWYLGVLAADGVVLLVDPSAPTARKERLYHRFTPHLRPFDPSVGVDVGGDQVTVSGRVQVLGVGELLRPHPDLALMLSTSGSTASPKLVRLSARALASNATAIAAALDLSPQERALASLPLTFSYGLSVLHSHLAAGASVVLTGSSLAQSGFWTSIGDCGCTSIAGVPATYRALVQLRLLNQLGPVKTLTQAGGRLDPGTSDSLREHVRHSGRQLVVMYGQTEATARITVLPPSQIDQRPTSVGRPIQGSLSIVTMPDGDNSGDGEIAYEGQNVMMGYAHAPQDVAAPDQLGSRLLTGDVGRLDVDGYLYVTGRQSRYAKVDGNRLNLDEIEDAVAHLGEFHVVDAGDSLVVVAHQQPDVDRHLLGQVLAGLFNIQARSWTLRRVDQVPMTSSGKVDRTALAELVMP